MIEPETRLWLMLCHDIAWKFRRQEPIGPFICDFVCYPKRLIIEVDGAHHDNLQTDTTGDTYLSSLGFRVLRVWNDDVMIELDDVIEGIVAALESRPDRHRNRPARHPDR